MLLIAMLQHYYSVFSTGGFVKRGGKNGGLSDKSFSPS
jgi:hypothetical protein